MRTFYSAVFYCLLPFLVLRLLWRSLKAPDYRKRWRERFAYYDRPMPHGIVWFHAVSVGEAEALFPLVKLIQAGFPQQPILVTTTTPTGSARVQSVLGVTVEHVYLPYDVPVIIKRFMAAFKPKLAVVMETEIWPNLCHFCGTNNIPLFLINARLSEKSTRGYGKLPSLIRPALAQIKIIAAQTQADAERYLAIGATCGQVRVAGNIKYDLVIAEATLAAGKKLKADAFKGRFVWLAASTHSGEEQILLEAYNELKKVIPELLLMIAPRHPERFLDAENLCRHYNLRVVTRGANMPVQSDTDIYLADTMGELKMLYAASDVAFVAGSLVPVGGHNILEACAAGVPVLFGPYMANFKEIAAKALAQQAARQCIDKREIVTAVFEIYSNPAYRNTLTACGTALLANNRGALNQYYQLLSKEIAV